MSELQRGEAGQMNPYAAPVVDDGALWNPSAGGYGRSEEGMRTYPLASRWHRLVARIIDGMLTLVVMVPGLFAAMLYLINRFGMDALSSRPTPEQEQLLGVVVILGMWTPMLPFLLYQWHLLVKRGATTGKRLMGLRVVRTFGAPLTWGRVAFVRECIPMLVGFLPAGYLFALFDSLFIFGGNRTCLHDMMADTRVISVGRNPEDWTPEAIAASRWHATEFG